ncbi:helix-turn-helix domain-containing protein [Sphaerotilus natans]|uniref:helix-turn-helix domain-containing protein n=1 Tax=Sphaerotilus natans TaxID=34103 RepID=UPI00406D17D8
MALNDRLAALLPCFPLHAGPLTALDLSCGSQVLTGSGRLHLLLRGPVQIEGDGEDARRLPREQWLQPALVWLPAPARHRLMPMSDPPMQVFDVPVDFGESGLNPLLDALPPRLVLARRDLPAPMGATLALIVEEVEGQGCAHAPMLSRLVEVLLLQWLRHQLDRMRGGSGSLLAGLSDPALRPVLDAIHRQPEHAWSLAELARLGGLSRTALAERFASVVGQPPGDYLLDWRLRRARLLLREGLGVAEVATAVGYGSAAALTRVFSQRLGMAPARWRREQAVRPTGVSAMPSTD